MIQLSKKRVSILSSNKTMSDCELAGEAVMKILNLKERFIIPTFSNLKGLIEFACQGLIEFACQEDGDELLDAKEVFLHACTLANRHWSLGVGTIHLDFLKTKDRWVLL